MKLEKNFFLLLLYVNDMVLLERVPSDINKQLRIHKDFCSGMSMIINLTKPNLCWSNLIRSLSLIFCMIMETWRNWIPTNILGLLSIINLTGITTSRKMINGRWKAYFGLQNNCKLKNLVIWDKKNSLWSSHHTHSPVWVWILGLQPL